MDIISRNHQTEHDRDASPSRKNKPEKSLYKKRHLVGLIIAIVISGAALGSTYFDLPDKEGLSRTEKKFIGRWKRVKDDGKKIDFKEGEYFRITFYEDSRGELVQRWYDENKDNYSKESDMFSWNVVDENDSIISLSGYDRIQYEFIDENTLKLKDPKSPDSAVYKRMK